MGMISDVIKTKVIGSEIRKGIQEIKKQPEEKIKIELQKIKCPKCKKCFLERHVKVVAHRGFFSLNMKAITTYTFFCPLCGYESKKEM